MSRPSGRDSGEWEDFDEKSCGSIEVPGIMLSEYSASSPGVQYADFQPSPCQTFHPGVHHHL